MPSAAVISRNTTDWPASASRTPGVVTAPPPSDRIPSWVAQRVADDLFLDAAELLLAVSCEDLGDGAAGLLLDGGVGVEHRQAHRLGQAPPDGGLPRAGQADQHGLGRHLGYPDARTAVPDGVRCGHRLQIAVDVAPRLLQRVTAELVQHRAGQHQGHHGFDDDGRGGHRAHIGALVDRDGLVTGAHVDGGQRARHSGDRFHRGPHPQRQAVGHAALQAAGPVGGAHHAVGARVHLVVGLAAAAARGREAVADLDALDGLDPHHRGGELAVEPVLAAGEGAEPDGQAVGDHLDDAAEGVAVLLGGLDLGDHVRFGGLVEGPHRALVDAGQVGRAGRGAVVGLRGADRDDVGHHLDPEDLAQELAGDGACGDPRGGLACTGALENGPGVVEAVLEHAGEVGVTGTGPRQRRVAGTLAVQLGGVDRVGGHHGLPLGPLAVADLDGDRAAERAAVPNPGQNGDLILLELHPGAPAVAQPAAGQLGGDVLGGDPHAGDHAFDHGYQRAAV